MELIIYHCLRCDWKWASRLPQPPIACARCKSSLWQRPRVKVSGRWTELEKGKSFVIPWPRSPDGGVDTVATSKINHAISEYGRRTGKRFLQEGVLGTGLIVTRIS